MNKLLLFTDGSVNTKTKIGYGAYLTVSDLGFSIDILNKNVKVKRFEQTSSTKLEIQTLLWALSDINISKNKVIVYTDSQNIIGLNGRRDRLEKNNYRSKTNKLINNYKLYQEFYKVIDKIDFELVKVRGHNKSNQKNYIDRLFTIVDKASRNALRNDDQYSAIHSKISQ